MQTNRCGNYVLEIELLPAPGTHVLLRVPVRRCLLSEHLFSHLVKTEQGRDVVRKLILASSDIQSARSVSVGGNPEEQPDGNRDSNHDGIDLVDLSLLRAALGPDLEPIHHTQCMVARCNQSCTPGYRRLLEQFGDPVSLAENGIGCPDATIQFEEFEESGVREY